MRTPWMACVAVAGCVVACHKEPTGPQAESPGAAPSSAELDALWKLAPDGTRTGLVVSPRGVAMVERAIIAVGALLATPELAPIRGALESALTGATGSAQPTLAELGLARDHGAALFVTSDEQHVLVVPVGDRDRFLAKWHGSKGADGDSLAGMTCKSIGAQYVCAQRAALFAKLGRGGLDGVRTAAGARGDIELAFQDGAVTVALVAQLAPGEVVVRGAALGLPPEPLALFGTPSKPPGSASSAGFGVLDLTQLLARQWDSSDAARIRVAGVDISKLVAGPVSFVIASGGPNLDLRVPLRDPAQVGSLIAHCPDIPLLAQAGATSANGACRVPVPPLGVTAETSVADKGLRLQLHGPAAPATSSVRPSALATEIAQGEWNVALYGHGTVLGVELPSRLPLLDDLPPEARMIARIASMVNELAVGVRLQGTDMHVVIGVRAAWSNPDDVVKKIIAVSPDQIVAVKAAPAAKAIANAAPGSPFARDVEAGTGGALALVAPIGVVAAVAIPAFMDGMKRTRQTEAERRLNGIARNAKRAYAETGQFPKGTAPLTPAAPCCGQPNNYCATPPAAWQQGVWKALDFSIDEPSLFQYSYESDGKTFVATAVGDLDCDTVMITYELRGRVENGKPIVTLTEPAVGAD